MIGLVHMFKSQVGSAKNIFLFVIELFRCVSYSLLCSFSLRFFFTSLVCHLPSSIAFYHLSSLCQYPSLHSLLSLERSHHSSVTLSCSLPTIICCTIDCIFVFIFHTAQSRMGPILQYRVELGCYVS